MSKLGTECKQGHDLTLPNAIYTSKKTRRCRVCWLTYQRTLQRKRRGNIPLDAPVRAYTPQKPRRSSEVMELIRLVSNDPELGKKLLQFVPQAQKSINARRLITVALSPVDKY